MKNAVPLTLVVFSMAGCPGPKDDDGWDEIWTISGGLRDQCIYPALYRNGMRLEFREHVDCEVTVSKTGRLTDAGLTEYIEASVPLSPGTL